MLRSSFQVDTKKVNVSLQGLQRNYTKDTETFS